MSKKYVSKISKEIRTTPTVYYRNINPSPAGEACILEISDWLCGKNYILYYICQAKIENHTLNKCLKYNSTYIPDKAIICLKGYEISEYYETLDMCLLKLGLKQPTHPSCDTQPVFQEA